MHIACKVSLLSLFDLFLTTQGIYGSRIYYGW